MSILLKRLMVLLFIPAEWLLLMIPLPASRYANVEHDFVFISAAPLLSNGNI